MQYHIKNCKVIQKGSKFNGKKVDILIEKGKIVQIGKKLSSTKATTIEIKNLHVSSGWVDIGTHLGEPGYEHRETLESLSIAAKYGGYTDLVTMPNSLPVVESKAQIQQLRAAGDSFGLNIHPIAALSHNLEGKNISEYIDLHKAGAVAFSDGLASVQKAGLLLRALQYAKHFDGVIFQHPSDASLSNENQIHEGEVSTSLGMKGSPSMAEILMVFRDLNMQQYSDSKLCLHLISAAESIKHIKAAKRGNDKVYAGVSYMNLVSTHDDLLDFDSNYKVSPVLRTSKDKKTLRSSIGDVDYISSNHCPLESEKKELEFPYADQGAIGLETCFAALSSHRDKDVSLESIVEKLTSGPSTMLNIDTCKIEEGSPAKLTLFDPDKKWTYTKNDIKSTSKNSPFIDQEFNGQALGTINGTIVFLRS